MKIYTEVNGKKNRESIVSKLRKSSAVEYHGNIDTGCCPETVGFNFEESGVVSSCVSARIHQRDGMIRKSNTEFIRLIAAELPRETPENIWALENFDRKFQKVTKAEMFEFFSSASDTVKCQLEDRIISLERERDDLKGSNIDAGNNMERAKERIVELQAIGRKLDNEKAAARSELRSLKTAILELQKSALGV